jgi:hypothetical protein
MPVETINRSNWTTWIVTVDAEAPVDEIRRAIELTGFKIQKFLLPAAIFVVYGAEDQAEKARRIHGVIAVEADLEFDVGPPDASIS